jgi:SAM-dependent methyltransferase
MSYDALARHYDALMRHADYTPWLELLAERLAPGGLVLDAACGTGTLTALLVSRGYQVVAADASPAMLAEARQKSGHGASETLFLCQRLEELDLYGTVQAAVSSLDSLNYIVKPSLFRRALKRVFLFLEPGGAFIFDLKTPESLAAAHGRSFVLRTDDVFCAWESSFADPYCYHDITLFERDGALWRRGQERHVQRAYPAEFVLASMREAGFENVTVREDILPEQGRLFFSGEKGNEN